RPVVTAWQPEQLAFANASPRDAGSDPASSAFIFSVAGLAATPRDIRPGLQALSVSTTRARIGNLRIIDAYRAGAGTRQCYQCLLSRGALPRIPGSQKTFNSSV